MWTGLKLWDERGCGSAGGRSNMRIDVLEEMYATETSKTLYAFGLVHPDFLAAVTRHRTELVGSNTASVPMAMAIAPVHPTLTCDAESAAFLSGV